MSDAHPLGITLDVSAVPARPAGAGRYIVELSRALAARADVEVTRLSRRHDRERWARDGRVLAAAPDHRVTRLAWEQVALGRNLERWAPEVHHSPHYTMPERSRVPVVVTVHDCTYFDHPEWHERSKVLLFRRAIRRAARRAAVIVCVSDATAAALEEHCSVQAPVVVAPHGVDTERFGPAEPEPGADTAALEALGLDGGPYVAFLGTVEPRKNVAGLVRAFGLAGEALGGARLVIAGGAGWRNREVEAALDDLPHADRVRRLGYLDDDHVPALLRNAAAVAYPSWSEGYGLPALEALATGAPLITTAGTAMAELAGDAAVVVPAGDDAALAEALVTVVRQDEPASVRAGRSARGLALAAARTWSASAERHVGAYRMALGHRTSGRGPH
jgi:glycosyltransferase involved in cell wall biosynthesis